MSTETADTGSGEVTFVNGVAESQATEGDSSLSDNERGAAMAAVREAMKAEGQKAAKEAKEAVEQDPLRPRGDVTRGPDGKFLSKAAQPLGDAPEVPKDEPKDDDSLAVKRVLAERKQIAAQKAQQAQEAERARRELQSMYAQLQQEKQAIAQERARMEMLRKDPIKAIRENGWDPEEFILDIARDGTPEGQAARQQRELQAKIREMEEWKASIAENERRQAEAMQQRQAAQYRQSVEQEFLKISFNEEKYPHVASFYKGHEAALLAEADVIAEQYRNLTGQEASFADVAEYIEERNAKWYKSRRDADSSQLQGSQQVQASVTQGRSTQGNATGRTLNPANSGERRSLGVNMRDLDGDDRRDAAMEAVRQAIVASGERR